MTREDVVIVGGGQAGLAAAHCLERAGISPLVLDAGNATGASWRGRWDTLRTFTSARCSALPGLPFGGDPDRYPSKDEVADYLARYARHFGLRVRHGARVSSLRVTGGGFELDGLRARRVVIAAGAFGVPWTPPVKLPLPALHAARYRNPDAVPPGRVLVVGAGNTGIQIARELVAAGRAVVVSRGRPMIELPQEVLGRDIFWWMQVFGVMDAPVAPAPPDAPMGADPVIGDHLADLGVRLVGRATGFNDGAVLTADGETVAADVVIWATGYRHDWSWLDPALRGEDGLPRHDAGIGAVPGSYFLGLHRLRSRGSALLGFVGADAERLMAHLAGTLTGAVAA